MEMTAIPSAAAPAPTPSPAPTPTLPQMNLQEVNKQLAQTVYDLGRAQYEKYVAECRVNALQARAADLAQQANRLNQQIQQEIQAKIAEGNK